jgi:AcrR family transcriptional regulator
MAPSRISRAAILERALAVADSDGLDAVAVRRLARDLGVTPMALYWHVADKDALLDALADHLVARVDRTLDPALDWPEQLRSLLRSLLAVLRAHPGAAELVGIRNSTSEASLQLIETTLDVLARGGFSPADAVTVARQILRATAALVAAQPRAQGPDPRTLELLTGLPTDRFGHVVAAAAPLASCPDPDAADELGIDVLVAGIATVANRSGTLVE